MDDKKPSENWANEVTVLQTKQSGWFFLLFDYTVCICKVDPDLREVSKDIRCKRNTYVEKLQYVLTVNCFDVTLGLRA